MELGTSGTRLCRIAGNFIPYVMLNFLRVSFQAHDVNLSYPFSTSPFTEKIPSASTFFGFESFLSLTLYYHFIQSQNIARISQLRRKTKCNIALFVFQVSRSIQNALAGCVIPYSVNTTAGNFEKCVHFCRPRDVALHNYFWP